MIVSAVMLTIAILEAIRIGCFRRSTFMLGKSSLTRALYCSKPILSVIWAIFLKWRTTFLSIYLAFSLTTWIFASLRESLLQRSSIISLSSLIEFSGNLAFFSVVWSLILSRFVSWVAYSWMLTTWALFKVYFSFSIFKIPFRHSTSIAIYSLKVLSSPSRILTFSQLIFSLHFKMLILSYPTPL